MADDAIRLRIALAQVNPTVGDIEGNASLISAWIARAREAGAQLVVFPEQTVTGYPAEDLWLKPHFLDAARRAVDEIASGVGAIAALVGFPERDAATHNSVALLGDGQVRAVYRKVLLPNYGVFDERRYFEPGDTPALVEVAGARVGLTICEDIWYPGPPASVEALAGASLIVNPSASPYHRGRGTYRERMVQDRARETGAAFAVCNLVGGQDELVFDGHSVVVSRAGRNAGSRGPVRRAARPLRPRARPESRPARSEQTSHERSRRGQPPPCSPGSMHRRRATRSSRSLPTRWSPWPRSTRR